MLDSTSATGLTIADLAGWVVAGVLALLSILVSVIAWFLGKLHDRFEGHLKDAEKRDEEIEQLKIAVARAEEKHGETTRNLADLKTQIGEVSRKVDALPRQIVELLTARRDS